MKTILVIVAKEPVPGKVKTRLLPHLTASQASELYRLFIHDMIDEMSLLSENTLAVAYAPKNAEKTFKKMLPHPIRLFPQQGADLGERLTNVFERMFDEGYEQVHIINSDSPDLPHRIIKRAIELLKEPRRSIVLGPCFDGGYYLVGLSRPIPELFVEIPWSTSLVLKKTIERAHHLGFRCDLLDPWYDIDTHDDILQFLARNEKKSDDNCRPGCRTLRHIRAVITEEL